MWGQLNSGLQPRVIVSENRLSPLLRAGLDYNSSFTSLERTDIPYEQLQLIIARWRSSIDRQATLYRKHAVGTLESLPTGCLYEHLDRPEWKRAATACEILRHPTVSKNSGWLDTRALQARIANIAASNQLLHLIIGWGQPKRDAGGLKTAGPFADLAETYAIARLGSIAKAMAASLSCEAKIKVLSGGTRFRPALFTEHDLCGQYDDQRQRIADTICGAGTFIFADYETQLTSPKSQERHNHYLAALKTISDEMIGELHDTVLMNIDWHSVFKLGLNEDPLVGQSLPTSVRHWVADRSRSDAAKLIRAALLSIVTPRRQAGLQQELEDTADLVQDTVAFMRSVAWESTRKYIALHAADGAIDHTFHAHHKRSSIRLTVHQKRGRPDIPAIFTLGSGGGNALSQHVNVRIDVGGRPHFEPLSEILSRQVRPVFVLSNSRRNLFDWLHDSNQPLCFSDAAHQDAIDLIGGALDY